MELAVVRLAMKFSNFFGQTLRDVPAEADVASHSLLMRAGFIRPLGAGDLHLPAPGQALDAEDRGDPAGRNGQDRRAGNQHAGGPAGRPVERDRALVPDRAGDGRFSDRNDATWCWP